MNFLQKLEERKLIEELHSKGLKYIKNKIHKVLKEDPDYSNSSYLEYVIMNNYCNLLGILIKDSYTDLKIKFNTSFGTYGLLITAIKHSKKDIVELLLFLGIQVEDESNKEAMKYGIEEGNFDIFKLLFKEFKDAISIKDKHGNTLLHLAIKENRTDIAKFIVFQNPCCLNIPNNADDMPIHYAIKHNRVKILKSLLSNTKDLAYVKKSYGITLLQYAIEQNKIEIVELLIKEAPKLVNLLDDMSYSPLIYTIVYDKPKIFNVLLNNKADITIKGKNGRDLLYYAKRYARKDIEDLLLKTYPEIFNSSINLKASKIEDSLYNSFTKLEQELEELNLNLVGNYKAQDMQ